MKPGTNETAKSILVLWDGDCGFCAQSLEWIKSLNPAGEIHYLSFHSDEAKPWREKIGVAALEKAMHVVNLDGKIYAGADGFRVLLSRVPKYRWLSCLMGLPLVKQICRAGYRVIANNRFFFSKHSCKLKNRP